MTSTQTNQPIEWRATCYADLGVDPWESGIAEAVLDAASPRLGAVTGCVAGALSITFSVDAADIVAAADAANDTARSLVDQALAGLGLAEDIEPEHFRVDITRADDPYGDHPHEPLEHDQADTDPADTDPADTDQDRRRG